MINQGSNAQIQRSPFPFSFTIEDISLDIVISISRNLMFVGNFAKQCFQDIGRMPDKFDIITNVESRS